MRTFCAKIIFSQVLLVLALSFGTFEAKAQAELPAEEIESYKEQSAELVRFLEFTLNTIGDSSTTPNEKDIIINQSYLKLFRDDKVQVEDDLVEGREVVTNKDIQAYLKDVDFFYKYAKFEFNITDVNHFVNDDNVLYVRVSLNRNLQGINIDGEAVNVNKERFVEVNVDRINKDLKIVSVYTTRLSEAEELNNWWSTLSYDWQAIFKRNLAVLDDTLSVEQLKRIVSMEELDLSNNKSVRELSALSKLTDLKKLNISNTSINDLSPLRSLTRLEILNCSQNLVSNIEPLKYSINLKELYCNGTLVSDISPLANFPKLEILHCYTSPILSLEPLAALEHLKDLRFYDTRITNLTPLSAIYSLEHLNLSYTRNADLTPLSGLSNLKILNIESTPVTDLSPLKPLGSLNLLFCNNTQVSSLEPLVSLTKLEKVYCDNTQITKAEARMFMQTNRSALVIYESEALLKWWQEMPQAWKQYFSTTAKISVQPSKEELQQAANISEVNVSGNAAIKSLAPLTSLLNLKSLRCASTSVSDLSPLMDLIMLEDIDVSSTQVASIIPLGKVSSMKSLNISGTKVSDLSPLGSLDKLEVLVADNTPIASIAPLGNSPKLKTIYCDNTQLPAESTKAFAIAHPDMLIVFQTEALTKWWASLSADWIKVFKDHATVESTPTREQLHNVISLRSLNLSDNNKIRDLGPLVEFVALKELHFSNTQISSLDPISGLANLTVLQCSRTPVNNLTPISRLNNLEELDIENTPVGDLEAISGLSGLKVLKCSGTPIKKLNPLESLRQLEQLEFFTTGIKSLKPIDGLANLKMLKCYNTKISSKNVDKYKKAHPNVDVVYY
ncbi:hypothetical protein R9C00_28145 [Flammeovirgaceae bacterium SG7u.111]|nr:hypothetical protein [Flammeovirgaceae bacterium SG7u.132]WPO35573.1 hypothetical protein R9C00_28145 [Flammeovirgaceae bacterium SG7u.111]